MFQTHFYGFPKFVEILRIGISETKDICSLPNPPFKTRLLVGSIPGITKQYEESQFFDCQPFLYESHDGFVL